MKRKRIHGKRRSPFSKTPDLIPKYTEKGPVSEPTRYFHSQLENISQRRLDLPHKRKDVNVGKRVSLHGGGGGSVTFHKGEGFSINPDLAAGGSINLGKTRISGEYGTGGRFNIGGSTNIGGGKKGFINKEGLYVPPKKKKDKWTGVNLTGGYSKTGDQPGAFGGRVSTNIKGVDVSGGYSKLGDKPSYDISFSKMFANKRFNLGVRKTGSDVGVNIGANIKF